MKEDDFYELVKRMRKAQKDYFRTRESAPLEDSKRLEREVDKAILEHEDDKLGGKLF